VYIRVENGNNQNFQFGGITTFINASQNIVYLIGIDIQNRALLYKKMAKKLLF